MPYLTPRFGVTVSPTTDYNNLSLVCGSVWLGVSTLDNPERPMFAIPWGSPAPGENEHSKLQTRPCRGLKLFLGGAHLRYCTCSPSGAEPVSI